MLLKGKKNNSEISEKKALYTYYILLKSYPLKKEYNSIIPLHLYTCWHTKKLPPVMNTNYQYLVESNPKITFHLYDEEDCRNFILNNFEKDVLNAYDSLIPCSYKSDLWRFCVLYINGGIYMDIKYKCINNFKFIALTEKEHFVRDKIPTNVYTALIVCLPKNEIMKKCIRQIVENLKNKYYGKDTLDPTGPGLLGSFFTNKEKNYTPLYHDFVNIENKITDYYIVQYDRIILRVYKEYRNEQKKYQKKEHYTEFYKNKNIYK
jgi:mannosyltransferase OCH1-like enzyme